MSGGVYCSLAGSSPKKRRSCALLLKGNIVGLLTPFATKRLESVTARVRSEF
jgi:hypothetical protein